MPCSILITKALFTLVLVHLTIGTTTDTVPPQKGSATSALGAIYRSARDDSSRRNDGWESRDAPTRCTKCSHAYDDRDRDTRFLDSWFRRPATNSMGYENNRGAGGYENNRDAGGYEDRNWYYQPDSRYDNRIPYDDRLSNNRNDDRYSTRYDDRYNSRYQMAGGTAGHYDRPTYGSYERPLPASTGGGYYDRYEPRPNNDYRGNGYDNRDPIYHDQMRDRFYDRGSYGSDSMRGTNSYYDRDTTGGGGGGYNERYPTRGNDYKSYRPYDDTYSGTSGYDNSGRGYYFASRPLTGGGAPRYPTSDSVVRPHPQQHNQQQQNGDVADYGQSSPIESIGGASNDGHKSPPRSFSAGLPSSTSSSSSAAGTSVPNETSGSGHRGTDDISKRLSQKDKTYNSNNNDNNNWVNRFDHRPVDREQYYTDFGDNKNKGQDREVNSYGTRPRPLGTGSSGYLYDRDDNSVVLSSQKQHKQQNDGNYNGDDNKTAATSSNADATMNSGALPKD